MTERTSTINQPIAQIRARWQKVCLLCGYTAEDGHEAECPGSVDLSDALDAALTHLAALLDVAEAAQGVIHDASLTDNYVSHASTRKLSDALKKLPQEESDES